MSDGFIIEEIVDRCSLYRLATGLRIAAVGAEGVDVARTVAARLPGIAEVVDRAGDVDLDLVIADSEILRQTAEIDGFAARFRPGGLFVVLGDIPDALPSSFMLVAHGASFAVWMLHPTEVAVPGHQFGIVVEQPVYNGVVTVGQWLFPTGRWSLLVGRSGIGKTTLVELIAGVRRHRGVRSVGVSAPLFYVPQDAKPIADASVETNISLFAVSKGDVEVILRRLHLEHLRRRGAGDKLSGGEAQRVVIGQALVSRARTMLLDEPSAGLDQIRRSEVFYYLRSETGFAAATVLCVAHDFVPIAGFFDEIHEVINGVVVRHK